MVLSRYGNVPSDEDIAVLGQSITLPFSGKIAKSRFLKAGELAAALLGVAYVGVFYSND